MGDIDPYQEIAFRIFVMAAEELPAGVDALECDEVMRLLIVATPATEELMCLLETAPCILRASDPPRHLGLLKISPNY